MNPKIWLSSPHIGEHEQAFVKDAFDTNWIAPLGPHVDAFEKTLASYVGVEHAAALSSGTAAIHMALILLGVGQGDEVICQSFTFSASANPIVYQGATPIFVDSEPDTWNMDPLLLRQAILDRIKLGKKPKAIMAVHLYGMPAKMDEIMAVANEFGIPVVEDAAEALGSTYKGMACGSLGTLGVLSFNGNKIITTSGGGALLGNDGSIIERARFLSTQSRDQAPHFEHSQLGFNYRLSNVLAAIGRGQMMVLQERIQQRRFNHEYYRQKLSSIPGISFLAEPEGLFSNRWLTCIVVDEKKTGKTREEIRLALHEENIESRPLWKPLHMQPFFQKHPGYLNGVSEKLFQNGLCLPSGSNLTYEDLNRVSEGVINLLNG